MIHFVSTCKSPVVAKGKMGKDAGRCCVNLRRTLVACALFALPFLQVPALAGLGEASSVSTEAEFKPWCGKRNNDCKVTFAGDKIAVNNGDGITREQFKRYSCSSEWRQLGLSGIDHWEYTCLVFYTENSKEQFGTFMFVNEGAYRAFVRALEGFCGSTCRPIGPSFKVE